MRHSIIQKESTLFFFYCLIRKKVVYLQTEKSNEELMAKITVQNTEITVSKVNGEDYISLTDMAHSQMQEHIVFRWMSLKSTIEYLGEWEMLYNPNFNCAEFDTIRNAAGSNNFVLSVKTWIERTGAVGIIAERQHPRLCHHQRTYLPVEYGKHQCRAYQRWDAARRTARKTQPDCHSADAGAGGE